ncbi:amidophosphoribosyltransferase [Echinicola strongylocentroti]|uniref:Amidophosphoribosyltransferase n=1 Tax=Echinicola strongylocentroti TaxID=1795355 RepID=A0A2Z4ILX7_9BACT|nr:alanine racemase [Echinicola strongylocentroti]AWW31945.1 amidophosphoribosyltransferase [Echinicola strongylocentroti]
MPLLKPITSPTLLANEAICKANIARMAKKAAKHHVALIPHFKTHQSLEVGNWYKEFGINEITVSSIQMAAYFSGQSWKNIHIAFPFNPLEINLLNRLVKDHSISIQLVNAEVAQALADRLTSPVEFFIEIDAGYGRAGVEVSDFGKIEEIMRIANRSDKLDFKGFYIHAGHTYHANKEGIHAIHGQTKAALRMLKDKYCDEFPDLITRSGDTPSCSIEEDFEGIDEIGPGNFAFYDLTQASIGSCDKSDIAVALAAPVVDIRKEKREILIHGGGIHLAKDVLINNDGTNNYGEVVLLTEQGWTIPATTSFLKSISQEHGLIKATDELINNIQIGDILGILPVHSCMTADCMRGYFSLKGEKLDHLKGQKAY